MLERLLQGLNCLIKLAYLQSRGHYVADPRHAALLARTDLYGHAGIPCRRRARLIAEAETPNACAAICIGLSKCRRKASRVRCRVELIPNPIATQACTSWSLRRSPLCSFRCISSLGRERFLIKVSIDNPIPARAYVPIPGSRRQTSSCEATISIAQTTP
jgi:hypothetical protein